MNFYRKSISLFLFCFLLIFVSMRCYAQNKVYLKEHPELVPLVSQANDSVLQPICIKYCQTIIDKSRKLKYPIGESMALQILTIHYFHTGDYDSMLKTIESCKKACTTDDCIINLYGSWNNAVSYSLNSDNLQEAMNQLKLMQKYALKHNHHFGIMKSYYGLGNCYNTLGQYGKAYEQYSHALDVIKKNKLHCGASELVNIAQNAIKIHRLKEAEDLLKEALNGYDIPKFMKIHIYALLFDINSQPEYKNMSEAMKYKSLLERENPNERTYTEASLIACNDAYYNYYTFLKHDYVNAEKYISMDNDSMQYFLRKANNMNLQNKTERANEYYKKAMHFYDSRKESENRGELEKFAIQNNLDKALEDQNALKMQNIQLREKWQLRFIVLGLIAFVTVVTLLSIYFFRRMKNMRQRKEEAEISERRKTLFLQNMSHEIRTPLNAIVGFTDLLTSEVQDFIGPEERNMMVNLVRSNSELLGTLVNDILDVSKFESGTYKLNLSEMNVYELCGATVETVRMRVQPGVELIYEPGDKELIMHTDAQRVQQVIINYLTNACKYTSKGSIIMAYEVMEDKVRFSVTDTGMGIKPEDAETVFERFQMLESKVSGIGLGLHICRLIANLLNAHAYVDTSYTQGARFVFDHPLNK